MSSMSMTREYF